MTDILDNLFGRELIGRQRSTEDRRNYLISLTESGRALADRAETAVLETCVELAQPLTEPAPSTLLALCKEFTPTTTFPSPQPTQAASHE